MLFVYHINGPLRPIIMFCFMFQFRHAMFKTVTKIIGFDHLCLYHYFLANYVLILFILPLKLKYVLFVENMIHTYIQTLIGKPDVKCSYHDLVIRMNMMQYPLYFMGPQTKGQYILN